MEKNRTLGRHHRLLRIHESLHSGDFLSVTDLARRLSVSKRTIYRDLEVLRASGTTLEFHRAESKYRVGRQSDSPTPLALAPDELAILVAALQFSPAQCLPTMGNQLMRATAKLLAAFPWQVDCAMSRLARACRVDQAALAPSGALDQVLPHIIRAIGQRRLLNVELASTHDTTVRTQFAPYQVIATSAAWRVVGRSTLHGQVCAFDASQFVATELTDRAFAIPRQFRHMQ